MAVAHNASAATVSLEARMLGEKISASTAGQQHARARRQDFGSQTFMRRRPQTKSSHAENIGDQERHEGLWMTDCSCKDIERARLAHSSKALDFRQTPCASDLCRCAAGRNPRRHGITGKKSTPPVKLEEHSAPPVTTLSLTTPPPWHGASLRYEPHACRTAKFADDRDKDRRPVSCRG
jgi:hypothetical protein